MPTYGQFCPVAKAMEVLDERWTLLIVRELLLGNSRFNELRRGVPRMSPALLVKRLRALERAGVVRRDEDGRYLLTESGHELKPIVDALGSWGVRWVGELGDVDLDPHLLMWDVRRTLPLDRWPRGRTVVAFDFGDVAGKARSWWIVVNGDDVDVCDVDPGYETAARVETTLRTLTHVWRGDVSWSRALGAGDVVITGTAGARRDVPGWIGQSLLSAVPRP
jgi:DNA-binding HxlR family transcriptional regulator